MIRLKTYLLPLIIFLTLLGNQTGFSQSASIQPKGSLSVDIGIPTKERNVAFDNVLEGLFNGGINYQYNIYKGLTIGAGAKYSFFINNRFALGKTVGKGGMHIPGVYAKIGYEKFTTDRFSFNFGIRTGYSAMIMVNDSNTVKLGKPFVKPSFFVEPQLELLVTSEKGEPDGFSLVLGYAFYLTEFNPEFLSQDKFFGLKAESSIGITRFFTLGFGYRHYFGMN